MGYQGQEWDTSLALLGCIWEEKKGGAHTDTHVGAIRILSAQPLEL